MTINALGPTATQPQGLAATGSSSSSPTSPADALMSVTSGDTFLQLLVAQLKYQDPMNPTDGTQFLTQTAQMSEAANMSSLIQSEQSVLSDMGTLSSTSMIGKQVKATLADGTSVTGLVDSVAIQATGPVLHVSGKNVPLSAVQEVSSPSPAATTPTSSTSATATSPTATPTTTTPTTTSTTPTTTSSTPTTTSSTPTTTSPTTV